MRRLGWRVLTSVDRISPRNPPTPFPPLRGGRGRHHPALSPAVSFIHPGAYRHGNSDPLAAAGVRAPLAALPALALDGRLAALAPFQLLGNQGHSRVPSRLEIG